DGAPDEGLQAIQLAWEEAQIEFAVEVLGDDLGVVVRFENHPPSIPDDGHAIVTVACHPPNHGTVGIGNVGNMERVAGEFQDSPLHYTKWAPGKLNQLNHGNRFRFRTKAIRSKGVFPARQESNSGPPR